MANTSYQVFLSSDGKHTVVVSADNQVEATQGLQWAQTTYEAIVGRYGLKGQQPKTNGEQPAPAATLEAVPECAVHLLPMVRVEGKHGPFWSCHQRNADGSGASTDLPARAERSGRASETGRSVRTLSLGCYGLRLSLIASGPMNARRGARSLLPVCSLAP